MAYGIASRTPRAPPVGLRHAFKSPGGAVSRATNDKQSSSVAFTFGHDRGKPSGGLDGTNQARHLDMGRQPRIGRLTHWRGSPAGRRARRSRSPQGCARPLVAPAVTGGDPLVVVVRAVVPDRALLVGLPAVAGVLAGTWLQQRVPQRTVSLLFSVVLTGAAVGLLLSAGRPDPSVSDDWLVSGAIRRRGPATTSGADVAPMRTRWLRRRRCRCERCPHQRRRSVGSTTKEDEAGALRWLRRSSARGTDGAAASASCCYVIRSDAPLLSSRGTDAEVASTSRPRAPVPRKNASANTMLAQSSG